MLKDIDIRPNTDAVGGSLIWSFLGGGIEQRLEQGVYVSNSFNWNHGYPHLIKEEFPFSTMARDDWSLYDRLPADYGVADNHEQIIDRWPELKTMEQNFIIVLTPVRREDQSDWGGWRWHKWGEYIGTQNPQHEYLYDDTHIDLVYAFSIVEVY